MNNRKQFSYVGWFNKPDDDDYDDNLTKYKEVTDFKLPKPLPKGIEAKLWKHEDEGVFIFAIIHPSDDPTDYWEELGMIKTKLVEGRLIPVDEEVKVDIINEIIEIGDFGKSLYLYDVETVDELFDKIIEGDYRVEEDINISNIDRINFYVEQNIEHDRLVKLVELAEKYNYEVTIYPETNDDREPIFEIFLIKREV